SSQALQIGRPWASSRHAGTVCGGTYCSVSVVPRSLYSTLRLAMISVPLRLKGRRSLESLCCTVLISVKPGTLRCWLTWQPQTEQPTSHSTTSWNGAVCTACASSLARSASTLTYAQGSGADCAPAVSLNHAKFTSCARCGGIQCLATSPPSSRTSTR